MSTIIHDWSHYNRYVDKAAAQISRQELRCARSGWAIYGWSFAKALSLSIIALGLALAMVVWAWREAKIHVPDVNVTIKESKYRTAAKPPVTDRTVMGKVVRNYVLFTKRTLNGVGVVVTGWNFADENDAKPDKQWCYLEPLRGGIGGARLRVDLPRSKPPNVSANVLSQLALRRADVEGAARACDWFQ